MSTPTEKQSKGTPKPGEKPARPPANGQARAAQKPTAAPQPGRPATAPRQGAGQQSQLKTTPAPQAKTASPTTPKTTTPPAPRPRAPGAAERDQLLEERRLQIRARQQERRQEVQQAKRQKLGTRYSIIVAAVLLVGLVSFFEVEHQTLAAVVSAGVVLVCLLVLLAVFNLTMPARKAASRPRGAAPASSTSTQETAAKNTSTDEAESIPDDVPLPAADPDSEEDSE